MKIRDGTSLDTGSQGSILGGQRHSHRFSIGYIESISNSYSPSPSQPASTFNIAYDRKRKEDNLVGFR